MARTAQEDTGSMGRKARAARLGLGPKGSGRKARTALGAELGFIRLRGWSSMGLHSCTIFEPNVGAHWFAMLPSLNEVHGTHKHC
jgi:hypothetical protein